MRWCGPLLLVLAVVAAVLYLGWPWVKIALDILHPTPTTIVESQAIDDNNSAIGTHGKYRHTIQFSPDGRYIAYIYRDATYFDTGELGARPLTMTDALQVRWFPIDKPSEERTLPLDSIDLRPDGEVYYNLEGSVYFSPDSSRIAGLCAKCIVLVDIQSGTNRKIHYDKEYFRSLAWLSGDEIVFTTTDEQNLTFWRLNVTGGDETRRKVYRETHEFEKPHYSIPGEMSPPALRRDSWSPNGRFVIFNRHLSGGNNEGLLDVATGEVRTFPFSLYYNYWKPDGSSVLIHIHDQHKDKKQIVLIDTITGHIDDLTDEFMKAFGQNLGINFVSPVWTPDGKHVILHNTKHLPPASPDGPGRNKSTGYLIQLQPFQIVLSNDRFIRWSPIPGWVLLQGDRDDTFDWMNYAGTETVKLNGWPNNWTWSPDRRHAAQIKSGKVVVFQPRIPGE